jgi:hypothetical protein
MVFPPTIYIYNLKSYFLKVILKYSNNFATLQLFYRLIWVKLLMGDNNSNNITILFFLFTKPYWRKHKNLKFFKIWKYILHNKNIFVKDLMNLHIWIHIEFNPIYEYYRWIYTKKYL